MQINPYLFFGGNCEEAFNYYRDHLGGEIVLMLRFKEAPIPAEHKPAGWDDKVLHARIKIGDTTIYASDVKRDEDRPMQAFDLVINLKTAEEAERVFAILSDGGKVSMPMTESFFAIQIGR